jgi:hypothetical protein
MSRIVALALVVAANLLGANAGAGDVALIVNPANPEANLSGADLAQQHWRAGGRIYLILQETGSPEKALVLRRVYRMSEAELKQFWLGKLYRGEIAAFPRIAPSNTAVKRIVAHAPNALGFIDAAAIDASVKPVKIDGRQPGDSGYLLAAPVN